ncbi:MAG TPA: DUF192 domain-containing protein [Gracilimonas sp.]|uniref:DUF192 domain-containing protein n=1 Tax=Gracilimonas sp. TaxID=1974203 RepID=UPI002DADEE4A|nr:DUF192 domain-containing protein [Gracilimonas sp.]
MKFQITPIITVLLILGTLTSCQNKDSKEEQESDRGRQLELTQEVTFLNSSSDTVSTLKVAVADEQEERNQGLMDVNEMSSDAGMLFIFPEESELSFYMANTPLSLDIMFVNADSIIVRIHHSTTPFNSEQLPSGKPAKFVVETNAGYAVANDIQEGMRIRF